MLVALSEGHCCSWNELGSIFREVGFELSDVLEDKSVFTRDGGDMVS